MHVYQLDSIENEIRQTRQLVSSHQQSIVGVDVPRYARKTPEVLDSSILLSDECVAVDDDNVSTAPFMADKDILELIQSSKNIIDSDNENEMNNAALAPTSFEKRNIMKSMFSYLDAHTDGEVNNKIDDIEQIVDNLMPKKTICQVIYSQFGLAIHQNDHQARRRFVEWAQNEIAVVHDFHKRILFSDEAHFWLNGYVNKQNCRIWSEANPQVYVETPLHPEN
ncbi:hypothetical protein TNCV_1996801 [Trichonephila clavipes]|uniref:Uncharacterized protein n=1 Tax=Trichonephila clavipes TaxID=2585209 RepID=A0A8X6V749_TRICX|nr:hypothetical protein TNCV_1996801 [Trichonephila clavipes]